MAKLEKKQKKEVVKIALADMTVSELASQAKQIASGITKKRLEKSVGRVKNVREIFNLRKQLARIKTVLNTKMRLSGVKS
jgi:ribosomal protein L29